MHKGFVIIKVYSEAGSFEAKVDLPEAWFFWYSNPVWERTEVNCMIQRVRIKAALPSGLMRPVAVLHLSSACGSRLEALL